MKSKTPTYGINVMGTVVQMTHREQEALTKKRRIEMVKAIKNIVVPYLREQKFKGSYPNFQRGGDSIYFQASYNGPYFFVNVSGGFMDRLETAKSFEKYPESPLRGGE